MRRDAIIAALAALLVIAWLVWQTRPDESAATAMQAATLLGDAPESFRRVTEPRPLAFPEDHALHPGFRNEWWYFTGNLEADQGPLGFQFTLFRFGLEEVPELESNWRADAIWMAHLALSDGSTSRFLSAERFARGAAGLAGAETDRWWLRDWQVDARPEGWSLVADAGDFAVEFEMIRERPIVLQGEKGYSRKGPDPGNATHYYSATRMAADGRVRIDGQWREVEGRAWLDREWGSSQLGEGLAGWDWFSLQLDDGRDVMVYRLRTTAGDASPWSAGTVVEPDGSKRRLEAGDFEATPIRRWRDKTGTRWPVAWSVTIPDADLDMHVEPLFDDQLWNGAVIYWEGAVTVSDPETGEQLGRGYLELSGYAD